MHRRLTFAAGSSTVLASILDHRRGVAQPGLERSVRDAEAAGSNPVAPIFVDSNESAGSRCAIILSLLHLRFELADQRFKMRWEATGPKKQKCSGLQRGRYDRMGTIRVVQRSCQR